MDPVSSASPQGSSSPSSHAFIPNQQHAPTLRMKTSRTSPAPAPAPAPAQHAPRMLVADPDAPLPTSPLSLLPEETARHASQAHAHRSDNDYTHNTVDEDESLDEDDGDDTEDSVGCTGQHASVVTASAILSRSGAIIPTPVLRPSTGRSSPALFPSGLTPKYRRNSRAAGPNASSRRASLEDFALPEPGATGFEHEAGPSSSSTSPRRLPPALYAGSSHSSRSSLVRADGEGSAQSLPRTAAAAAAAAAAPSHAPPLNRSSTSPALCAPGPPNPSASTSATWLPALELGTQRTASLPPEQNDPDTPTQARRPAPAPAPGSRRPHPSSRPSASRATPPPPPPPPRPRPRQRASNGSALEALGALLLHSREAKGRPSVLSFARPAEMRQRGLSRSGDEGQEEDDDGAGTVGEDVGDDDDDDDEDEDVLTFQRGSEDEGEAQPGGGALYIQSSVSSLWGRGRAGRSRSGSGSGAVTPQFHAPSSFLFGNAHAHAASHGASRSDSVRSTRSSSVSMSYADDDDVEDNGDGSGAERKRRRRRSQQRQQHSSNYHKHAETASGDDRSLWFRRFFGPPDQQQQSQSLNLPFGLKFPTAQASSLLTAKGRSSTLTIAERRARRFLLGPLAEDHRRPDDDDPAYRLVWTRRNQPSFQVERNPDDGGEFATLRAGRGALKPEGRRSGVAPAPEPSRSRSRSRQTSVDDSVVQLSPVVRSPPFRRTRSDIPQPSPSSRSHVNVQVPRPAFPYACDEPVPTLTASALLRRRRRKYGELDNAERVWRGGGWEGEGEGEVEEPPPPVSLAGMLGPSSAGLDLPEPPPSPLAMPGAWVGSHSYRRTGRRAWLWWEGKGDASPSGSFVAESPRARFGAGAGGSRAMSREFSNGSIGSPSDSRASPVTGKRRGAGGSSGLLSLPLLPGRGSATASASRRGVQTRKRTRKPPQSSHHLYEEGALWLPPPLLDDAGSSAASFEGLLGIKRMREQEEARKQLERLRARNRPTHKPGLITALGNFVKAAHAAEVSHKRMRREQEEHQLGPVGGRWRMMKRPGLGPGASGAAGAGRSLSALELGTGMHRGLFSGLGSFHATAQPSPVQDVDAEDDNDDEQGGAEGGVDRDAVDDADPELAQAEDEENEDPADLVPGTRLWWDRLFSGAGLGSGTTWTEVPLEGARGVKAKIASSADPSDVQGAQKAKRRRPEMLDRGFTEPAISRVSDSALIDAPSASTQADSSAPPSASASRRVLNASSGSESVGFSAHVLSTLDENQRTDFSAEFAALASSPRMSGEEMRPSTDLSTSASTSTSTSSGGGGGSSTGTKHVLFSTPLESPRLRAASSSHSMANPSQARRKSATLPGRHSDSNSGSPPLRDMPHAPRLVPIHISNPASPMTPLVSDASDPFLTLGRRRSGSASGSGAGSAGTLSPVLRGAGARSPSSSSSLAETPMGAPRTPRLQPTQMSLPPSPWTENGRVGMTPVQSTPKVFRFEGSGGAGSGASSLTSSPLARAKPVSAEAEAESAADEVPHQFSFRLSAELVRPEPGLGGLASALSPRLVPTKLEIIASPRLAAADVASEQANGLGISQQMSPLPTLPEGQSVEHDAAAGPMGRAKRALANGSSAQAPGPAERLTPTALFMSKPTEPETRGLATKTERPVAASRTATSRTASYRTARQPSSTSPSTFRHQRQQTLGTPRPQSQRSFFLWLLIGDLFLGTNPSVAAKAIDPSKTPPGTVEMGPIAGVLSHLVGFLVFTLAHVLDLATNVWENATMGVWFLRWLFLNVTGQTVLSRCLYEVYALVRDEWHTVALEDHEDRAGKRRRRGGGDGLRPRRGSWSGSAAAGAGEDDDDDYDDGLSSVADESENVFERALRWRHPDQRNGDEKKKRRGKPVFGLSKWQIVRGLTELACLQAVTRERYLAEGAGLEKLRGWRKRRKRRAGTQEGTSGKHAADPAAYSNTSTLTDFTLDRYSSSSDESEDERLVANKRRERQMRNELKKLDGSPATTASASGDEDEEDEDEESDLSDEEMIVTRQDADVLEFAKTPRSVHPPGRQRSGSGQGKGSDGRPAFGSRMSSASAGGASSYFPPTASQHPLGEAGLESDKDPSSRSTSVGASSHEGGAISGPPSARITPAAMFGMTPLQPTPVPMADGAGQAATVSSLLTVPSLHSNKAGLNGGPAGDVDTSASSRMQRRSRRGSLIDQMRVHGALWSDSARDLVKTLKWASRMAISAYGLHVHIVDLPPTFTPSGKRFNRQTFAHLSRLNPDDVLHAEIQTLDSEASYQPTFYIVRDFVRKVIVVSVRGTQSFSDIIVDLDINVESVALPALKAQAESGTSAAASQGRAGTSYNSKVPSATPHGTKTETKTEADPAKPSTEWIRDPALKAHAGIWRAAQSLIKPGSTLFDTLKAAMEELSGFGVVLTGHSLGAAIASAVALLISEYRPLDAGQDGVDAAEMDKRGVWLTRAGTGLPAGRPIRTIAFANPATVSAALADRAALGLVPLVTSVVLGSDVIPRAGHGQARELRRVLGALSRVRRRTAFGGAEGQDGEEDARVHIVRSWWDWRSICAAAREAEAEAQEAAGAVDNDGTGTGTGDEPGSPSRATKQRMLARSSKKLSLAGLDAFALDRKERIEDQLWKLRCDVEADLYAAVKARMAFGAADPSTASLAGLRTPGLSPWIGSGGLTPGLNGNGSGSSSSSHPQHPLHKLATRRQKLDMATLASEAREEERAEGGRVMLLPAGQSLLVEGGEIYVVHAPLSFFSLPELTPKMLSDHLPSAYEAAMEEDLVL